MVLMGTEMKVFTFSSAHHQLKVVWADSAGRAGPGSVSNVRVRPRVLAQVILLKTIFSPGPLR